MADDDGISKVLARYEDALQDHKHLTRDELAKIKRDLTDELEKAKRESSEATAREIKELREALADVTGFVAEQRTAAKEKDRVADSETTIVVPPDDVTVPDLPPRTGDVLR